MLASHITKHGLRVARIRAEELANDPRLRGPYDVVVSRATAPLVDLMKWSRPLLKTDGKLLTLKGGALVEEIDQSRAKFLDASIEVIEIRPVGVDWFEKEEKRLVKVTWPGTH
jgi:16S rRNA (guanine527-N7)-methyltransferase